MSDLLKDIIGHAINVGPVEFFKKKLYEEYIKKIQK